MSVEVAAARAGCRFAAGWVMRELGIDLIITMGCGDRCPVNSGK